MHLHLQMQMQMRHLNANEMRLYYGSTLFVLVVGFNWNKPQEDQYRNL